MNKRWRRSAAWFVLAALLFAVPALAANNAREKLLGSFGAWRAYSYDEGGQTVCYMVTTEKAPPKKRATPYLMITHRPVEASTDVVSYGAGALLDQKRGVKLRVGKAVFDLFSVRDTAWARDALTDHKLAAALRNAPAAMASGFAARKGGVINDRFNLTGAAAAYRAIGKACGLVENTPPKPPAKKPVAASGKKPH